MVTVWYKAEIRSELESVLDMNMLKELHAMQAQNDFQQKTAA